MKIVICGSMKLSKKMLEIGDELKKSGHAVVLPRFTEEYAAMDTHERIHSESVKHKIEHDLIRDYYDEIAGSDAVLIVNGDLNGIRGYIGGNSFLEMGFAHVLRKRIYLLNSMPEASFKDEIIAMQPIVLNGDAAKI